MTIRPLPAAPEPNIPFNALAGPVYPQAPDSHWNGLLILGEAPGRQEVVSGIPFTGPAGELLDVLLHRIGIDRDECYVMNPFLYQPVWTPLDNGTRKNNDIGNFFTKDVALSNPRIHNGSLFRSSYVRSTNVGDLRYIWNVIAALKPKAILALGATALWFTTGLDKISENRGKELETPIVDGTPVIATYHPAYALYRKADQEILDTIAADMALVTHSLFAD